MPGEGAGPGKGAMPGRGAISGGRSGGSTGASSGNGGSTKKSGMGAGAGLQAGRHGCGSVRWCEGAPYGNCSPTDTKAAPGIQAREGRSISTSVFLLWEATCMPKQEEATHAGSCALAGMAEQSSASSSTAAGGAVRRRPAWPCIRAARPGFMPRTLLPSTTKQQRVWNLLVKGCRQQQQRGWPQTPWRPWLKVPNSKGKFESERVSRRVQRASARHLAA